MDKFLINKCLGTQNKAEKENEEENSPKCNLELGEGTSKVIREPPNSNANDSVKSTRRRFLPGWKTNFPWIFYNHEKDMVICAICREIFKQKRNEFY